MNLGTATILRGDARSLPLPDDSVDLIVTSPPYFALRSYTDAGEHYAGQLGSEATPSEFLDALLEVTAECVRVLKPSGSLWVNLGDKYSGAQQTNPRSTGIPNKSLMGIPWRYAIACIDELGLILRAEVIWSKPNGLPESVTDRVRRSHEQWFYFEQSRDGQVVEPGAQALPLCSLCGRPADTRASLVARLHELDPRVENLDLSSQMGTDERVQGESRLCADEPGVVRSRSAAVPLAVPGDADLTEDPVDLLNDGLGAVVDQESQVRAPGAPVGERDASLAVDDSGQPSEVCRCSHPLIVNDEPWIPQGLAADLMQMVADGEADAQAVADYLSGDYARSHSTWFHFTLNPRYFSAVDEIREPHVQLRKPDGATFGGKRAGNTPRTSLGNTYSAQNPLGKLPGSVWTIATEPLTIPPELEVDHYAAFPTEWPKRLILGWCPSGICTACDEPLRPVVDVAHETLRDVNTTGRPKQQDVSGDRNNGWNRLNYPKTRTSAQIVGYRCACGEPTVPARGAVVLDPFGGTGTTALVSKALGRHGISVDMSADYCRVAKWRTNDRDQLAKVLEIEKAPPVDEQQLDLFGEATA